jgi:replication initiation and membrane attachment protein DnaB
MMMSNYLYLSDEDLKKYISDYCKENEKIDINDLVKYISDGVKNDNSNKSNKTDNEKVQYGNIDRCKNCSMCW